MDYVSSASIVHYPSRTSEKVATYISFHLSKMVPNVSNAKMDLSLRDSEHLLDHVIIIFPILGDDRIPELAEEWLTSFSDRVVSHSLCITGDFRGDELVDNVVAVEADRLLQTGGSTSHAPCLLLDTPVAEGDFERLILPWIVGQVGRSEGTTSFTRATNAGAYERWNPPLATLDAEDPLRSILSLLPEQPHFSLDHQGRCTALSFVDSRPYVRSILRNLPERHLKRVFALIGEMRYIRSLGVPFAGIRNMDVRLPESLEKLDLRGNYLEDFDFTLDHDNLALVNLAACDLKAPPEILASLAKLHTLILAKNRIEKIPRWFSSLQALERLTLYRNLLSDLGPGIRDLVGVRTLNLGANPWLKNIGDDLLGCESLEVLGLRLLGLQKVPPLVYRMPRLRWVDISKNPVFYEDNLSHPSITFADRMPRWDWSKKEDLRKASGGAVGANAPSALGAK